MDKRGKQAARITSAAQVLGQLRRLADPRVRAAMPRFGVNVKNAYGISTPVLRQIARKAGRNHRLALALWNSGNHEARILAGMTGDPAQVTPSLMERWARDFNSWDIVDGTCVHLFVFSAPAWRKAIEWSGRERGFVKRAGFTMMASLAVHDRAAPDAKFARLLPIVRREAGDPRKYVKKAVNWALRQIGKRNLRLNRLALHTARRIRETDSATARRVAADALPELSSPKVRKRLVGRARPMDKRRRG
jgi:3-methyladenine DNA glycosylase AlkD